MWFRSDDKFHSNPKVRRVRRSHPTKRRDASAVGVWHQAATWSADNMMDGFVPEEVVETFDDDWETIVQRLVEAVGPSGHGLFEPAEVGGEPGWIVHDFLEFNDSKEKILADRNAERMRVALMRDTKLVAAIKRRDQDRCRYCGCQVRWGNQRGPSGATYDHIKPVIAGGTNTIENVVIACRGCNSRKRHLTLREAGMRLLKPGSMGAPAVEQVPSSAGSTHGSGRVGSGPQNVLSTDLATEPTAHPRDDDRDDHDAHGQADR
jgi:hypothetical protein